jgi:hypothetical protein
MVTVRRFSITNDTQSDVDWIDIEGKRINQRKYTGG